MMNSRVSIPKEQIEDFCRRWQITELALFASVLREDLGPDSDIDVLVQFSPQAEHSFSIYCGCRTS